MTGFPQGGGPIKRARRYFCHHFGWHNKVWISLADCFDTCLACGEQFPHSVVSSPKGIEALAPVGEGRQLCECPRCGRNHWHLGRPPFTNGKDQ